MMNGRKSRNTGGAARRRNGSTGGGDRRSGGNTAPEPRDRDSESKHLTGVEMERRLTDQGRPQQGPRPLPVASDVPTPPAGFRSLPAEARPGGHTRPLAAYRSFDGRPIDHAALAAMNSGLSACG
jgi:hypothetical protein